MAECPPLLPETEEYLPSNGSHALPPATAQDEEYRQSMSQLRFVIYGVVGSVVIAMGILGNIINLRVLTRPNLKGVTFVYLTWLASADLMTLVVSITSLLRLHGIQPRNYATAAYYAYIELALVNACMASSVFLVVAVTVDRYFSVCLPTRYKEVHNVRRARRSIIGAFVAAFVIYIPICFQKAPVVIYNVHNQTEYLACEQPSVVNHPAFKVYLLIKELLVRLGPVVTLAILNTTIIFTFRKTLRKRRHLLHTSTANASQSREGNKKFHEERRLVVLLAGVVILFFICMTPAAILTLLNSDDKEQSFGFQLFRGIANVLELANYSMNFYVYCLCSSEIRLTFVRLFTCSDELDEASSTHNRISMEVSSKV